jgi:hypothetical protein
LLRNADTLLELRKGRHHRSISYAVELVPASAAKPGTSGTPQREA